MQIISHRANRYGPDPIYENKINPIELFTSNKKNVEIDVWLIGDSFYLKHDTPNVYTVKVTSDWLIKQRKYLLFHAKNVMALEWALDNKFHCFSHEEDSYAFTSKGLLIVYPGKFIPNLPNVIVMLPELSGRDLPIDIFGICTDFVENYEAKYNTNLSN